MKILNTREYVSVLKECIEQGKETGMMVVGNSMSPFLVHERDYIFFKQPQNELQKGDMVFFQRANGQYVMHRIWKVKKGMYYVVGDAQQEIEGPIGREQIFAIITKVKRKGKIIEAGDLCWEFFEHIWINLVPARRVLIKGYTKLKGIVYVRH